MSVAVIYQDEYIVAVNKPHGLLSVPGLGPDNQDCMIARLNALVPDARVVHRLDCHTSGVMLFAIGIDMQRALSRIFHDRKIEKQYVALLQDWYRDNQGVIELPMRCDIENRPRQMVDYENGKPAITRWRVLQRNSNGVRLLLMPETGRTHQLRVHCAASGYPIIGDTLYGDAGSACRMLLHANRLLFRHPAIGKPVQLHAACEF